MSSISTRFLMNIPDGADTFDNEKYLKGNLNIIDQKAAKVAETVAADGQNMEVVEVSFVASGSANTITSNGTFTKTYTTKPTIMPAHLSQSIGYSDVINYPYIPESSITLTSFTVTLKTSTRTENFEAGTLKMKFLVFGK